MMRFPINTTDALQLAWAVFALACLIAGLSLYGWHSIMRATGGGWRRQTIKDAMGTWQTVRPVPLSTYLSGLPLSVLSPLSVLTPIITIALMAIVLSAACLVRQLSRQPLVQQFERVVIVRKHSPQHFTLHTDAQGDFEAFICPSYTPDFRPGLVLAWLRFVDTGKCWDVSDMQNGYGYVYVHNAKGEDLRADDTWVKVE